MQKEKPHAGFSLIEVLIAMGIVGLIGYFLTSLLKTGSMGQKTLLAQDDARVLTDNIATLLSNPVACANTLAGISGSPNANAVNPVEGNGTSISNIVDSGFKAQFSVGNTYGNRGLKLSGITVGGSGVDAKTQLQKWSPGASSSTGTAFVQLNWLQTGSFGNQGNGPQNLYRYFLVHVINLDANNKITSCTAQAGTAADIVIKQTCAWSTYESLGSCEPPACPSSSTDLGVVATEVTATAPSAGPGGGWNGGNSYRFCSAAGSSMIQIKCPWAQMAGIGICEPPACPSNFSDTGVISTEITAILTSNPQGYDLGNKVRTCIK